MKVSVNRKVCVSQFNICLLWQQSVLIISISKRSARHQMSTSIEVVKILEEKCLYKH